MDSNKPPLRVSWVPQNGGTLLWLPVPSLWLPPVGVLKARAPLHHGAVYLLGSSCFGLMRWNSRPWRQRGSHSTMRQELCSCCRDSATSDGLLPLQQLVEADTLQAPGSGALLSILLRNW